MTYQICTKTVMDTSDPHIEFDADGICHYWHNYQKAAAEIQRTVERTPLEALMEEIKAQGRGKAYDCLIGVSGGIDSSFVAYQCHQLGLRPLAVHFDGGWDSDVSAHNLEVTTAKLGFERMDLKVANREINDLLTAYLRSSVVDIGVYADHAILATMYKLARKHDIKCVISGANFKTEYITPTAWVANKLDTINLRHIHRKFGNGIPLRTYPTFSFFDFVYYQSVLNMRFINLIDWFDFREDEVKDLLEHELGWQPYARKHGEVVFTKFYQNYILPTKFGIDKRRMHLSSLICSGQMTRELALERLDEPLYEATELRDDRAKVLAKLEMTDEEFDRIMMLPPRHNDDFPNDAKLRAAWMGSMRATSGLRRLLRRSA